MRRILVAVLCVFALMTQAEARKYAHHEVITCNNYGCSDYNRYNTTQTNNYYARGKQRNRVAFERGHTLQREVFERKTRAGKIQSDVRYIPNPPGTWRVAQSCAHRLAAYLRLGPGLDLVATWARKFQRIAGPKVGAAAIRHNQHHILGIIGGGPGAWRVADFNSGNHLNREYTVASFNGYFFVDPRSYRADSDEPRRRVRYARR